MKKISLIVTVVVSLTKLRSNLSSLWSALAGHLDSNHGESIPNFRGDALGGDQGCIVCHMMLSHQPSEFW